MNNNIQCSIESSTTKIELNSAVEGVFLVPELEGLAGLPEIRTTSGVNAGYDGGWTSAQNYDARLISIRGVIANPDISKVEDKRRAIASLLGQGRKEQLTLRFTTEAGNAYSISVRTISCEMALQRVLTTQEFLIQLRADDPLIYDDGATGGIAAILQPQRALGGFEINFNLPLAIGGGAEDTVVDNGNETVYPVIKLYGALHSPTVVNRTTNQQMQILADLQYSIDWHTYRSTTGDYILVNDGLDGAPMTISQLLGNATQTTYSGKNLLPSINTTRTRNGVTFTHNDDGSISLSGTATADTAYPINVNSTGNARNVPLSAGDYIVSGGSATSPTTVYMQAYYGATGGADRYTTGAFTLDADGTMGAYIYVKSGVNTSGKTIYPMVEAGSTATSYEPYVGGTASPNPDYPQPISTVTGEQNIEVVGKNLLDNSKFVKGRTDNGVIGYESGTTDLSYTDNSISFTTGTTYRGVVSGLIHAQPSTEYHFKATTNDAVSRFVDAYDTAGAWISRLTTSASGMDFSFTTPSNCGGVRISFQRPTVGSATLSDLMLELGSTATAYEPYQGQSYKVNLGKNLFDAEYYATATYTSGTYKYTTTDFEGGKTYTFSATLKAGKTAMSGAYVCISDAANPNSTQNYMTSVYNGAPTVAHITATFASNATIYFQFYPTTLDIEQIFDTYDFQLEEGSVRTPYQPFVPYRYELCKVGTYQDRIYKDDGKWYIEKQVGKVVLTGADSENWQYTNGVCFTGSISDYSRSDNKPLSDNFTTTVNVYGAGGVADNTSAFGGSNLGTQNRFYVKYTSLFTSAATIKTWLISHPTTVYYALATPTTTEITDEALLYQLNFLASLYGGVNNISLVGTGAQGEITVRYATDYTVNQDIITIDSQARTITLNGQDVYHLKTSESEFLVLAPGENKLYLTSEVSDDSGYAEVKFKQGYLSI